MISPNPSIIGTLGGVGRKGVGGLKLFKEVWSPTPRPLGLLRVLMIRPSTEDGGHWVITDAPEVSSIRWGKLSLEPTLLRTVSGTWAALGKSRVV